MKKAVVVFAIGMLLLACLPTFSQSTAPYPAYAKDAYYKSIPILKIWVHPLGYKVQFFSSKFEVSDLYVPLTWFVQGTESKAELIYGNSPEYPYFTIVWIDGKFDHIRLYVREDYQSMTWGVLTTSADLSSQFGIQEPTREF